MIREQAQARAAQLNAKHPDRASHSLDRAPRRRGMGGGPVRGAERPRAETRPPTAEARPRPPTADDPRPVAHCNIGAPYRV